MKRPLLTLVGTAIGIRLIAALSLMVVAQDGARNLRMGHLILNGRWHEALTIYPVTHPFYPMLIALGEALTGSPLLWACLLSAILGGLAVLPLYHLAKNGWNERVALISGLLYAFLPAVVDLHCDAMLEGTFFCLFFSSMALAWSAVETKNWPRAILAGVCAAAAWLTRPEGAYLVPLILLACALRPSRFALAAAPLALVPALVLAMPYQGFIKEQTGRYGISASPFSTGILGLFSGQTPMKGYSVNAESAAEFGEHRDIARYGRLGGPVVTVTRTMLRNLFYVPALLILVGLAFWKSEELKARPALYMLGCAGGYFIPAVLAFFAGTPFSHRYILVPAILLLPLAATGLLKAAAWAKHPKALRYALICLCTVMAVRDVRVKRGDKLPIRLAGQEIRKQLGEDRKILSPSRQVEYYARGRYVELLPGAGFADVQKLVAEGKVDVVVVDLADFRNAEAGLQEKLDAAYPLLAEFTASGYRRSTPVKVWIAKR